jgi:hypothetical protein
LSLLDRDGSHRYSLLFISLAQQWGERKLMLLELEFLTQYAVRPGTVVIYANCAPATRMPYLSSLFPHVQFVLVDPVPLDFDESQLPNVSVKQQQFDDALATEFAATAQSEAKTLLFIANATSDSPNGYLAGAGDDSGYVDEAAFTMEKMTAQAHWHRLLNSAKSLLKFTLPWTDDKTKYLDGDIVLPIWSGPTSTETRLVPNGNYRDWSHRHYEEQLMHYNNVTRVSLHEHGVTAEGLDGCGDCTAEVFILERYLERYPNMLQIAVGSQLTVTPSASGPAVQLKFDTTRFKDPEWQARQKAKREKFLVTLVNDHDGQPLTEEQMRAAGEQFDLQQEQEQNVEMAVDESSAPSAAAAAASSSDAMAISSDATMGAAASSSSGGDNASMEDAAPSFELSSAEQLKLAVGKFSQELSRRITNGGTRTLATLNEKMVQKAAFSRKNRK